MPNPVAVVRRWSDSRGGAGEHLMVWCPGCDQVHAPNVALVGGAQGPVWSWNGSTEAPSINPSLLVYTHGRDDPNRCHSFLRDGQWQFLDDSGHALAGQTVPMVPLPDWLVDEVR